MSIIISAVICTHNREKFIEKSITSLLQQDLDKDIYEIIVVDNRSTDTTAQIIKTMASRERNIKYIFEKNLGLSFARNAGWENTRGKYVAFLDDDAVASPAWLSNIVRCFRQNGDNIAITGGKVEPIWEVPPPPWLTPRLEAALAIIDWSELPQVINGNQWLAGVNVAYRKTILERFNGFNTELGRKGKKLLSMEEIFLRDQLAANGFKSFYDPKICVKHHIARSRLTKQWFFKRYFWQGVSEARHNLMSTFAGASFPTRLKLALSYFGKNFLLLPARWLKSRNRRTGIKESPGKRKKCTPFEFTCFSIRKMGYIIGLLGPYEKNQDG
jgi:glycosyltransferase involved in cell wall biosynthesis